MDFSHKAIEKKWQKYWKENKIFKTTDEREKKAYVLDMFPFPSGAGLHVGHVKGYTATDVFSRYKRMQNHDVLHPIGWDAFGLPAEQYALKTGNDPREFTLKNIDNFRRQLEMMGFSYDFDKEVTTSNPNYYKITQWIFQQLYKKGLAELKDVEVNWCQELGTVLANDEIINVNGQMVSERGEHSVVKKNMRQWVLKITEYAERLLIELDALDWPQSVKELQKNWIGKSTGLEITFKTENDLPIKVFTTRGDTIFGAIHLVLAPEHELVSKLTTIDQEKEIKEYIELAASKSEIERKDDSKEKSGVFTGSYAINPFTNEKMPVWISDYVLKDYGTGAVMSVPAHDPRDFAFAQKYNMPIKFVIDCKEQNKAFVGLGKIINSDFLNGMEKDEALKEIETRVIDMNIGSIKTNYKLRDWLFSRQRFYGEPFPVVYLEDGSIAMVDLESLPVELPQTDYIKPSGTGESPLANVQEWVNTTFKGQKARRETNTMPQTAGSSWYFLAYLLTDTPNNLIDINSPEAKERFKKWMPVDLYIGGQEHAVGHLLYSRFWNHVLSDIGIIDSKEPFQRYFAQGMILGPDGQKMSKSKGNVINPDDVVDSHGADTLRLYEMFMGPLDASLAWSFDGLDASLKWLNRCYRLINGNKFNEVNNGTLDMVYHETVKNVTQMIEDMKFNTAISKLMTLMNAFYKEETNSIYKPYLEGFIKMLSIFAPHISEEMWSILGNKESLTYSEWPSFDEKKLVKNTATIAIQVNGKLRATLEVEKGTLKEELLLLAKANENVAKFLEGKTIKKEIVVPDKIVNIVI